MKWKKWGVLYRPSENNRHAKLLTHVANPLPMRIKDDVYRVFYSGRDAQNRSSVGAVDIDIVKKEVICEHFQPFFEHGAAGSYYADGVSIGNCYEVNGIRYMLFMGWQAPENEHWRGEIGRLIVRSDLSLEADGVEPFLSMNKIDPISLSYPWVMTNEQGEHHMWYGSTMTWDAGNGEMVHVINYASSVNGDIWEREGLSVPYQLNIVQAFSRPTVVGNLKQGYEMWFSYRSGTGEKYRIGYAVSDDGKKWRLDLESTGIDISQSGWDSEMICYPYVFDHKGMRYMLYNGNGYGKTGFGLAVLESE
jgi:hypothetical protein